MKALKLIVASALVAGSASAALYTTTTGTGAAVNGFANSAGLAYQSASTTGLPAGGVSIGIFSTDSFAGVSTASQLLSLFTAYASGGTFSNPGPTGQRGTFSLAGSGTIASSAFAGKNVYVLVGNAVDLATATEFAVLKTTFTFNAADDTNPSPITLTVGSGNSSLLLGNSLTDLKTTNTDASVNPGFQTVALSPVPEPSAVLLGAIGVLGLLRRRRN